MFGGNGGANEVASLRAQVAQLEQRVQMLGGAGMGAMGGAVGVNPFMGRLQPSVGMMGGTMGMGGYYNAPLIQPQQGGGLINKVNSISLGDNFDLVAANKTASQTWTQGNIDDGIAPAGAKVGDFTPEALGMQKLLGTDQASADAAKSAQTSANWINGINAGVGAACAITGTVVNAVIQSRMVELQETYMNKMEGLAEKYMVLQERGMEINRDIMEGKQNTVVELAEIQAEVAKFQIRKESETSIQNTKTAASYGWVNGQMYGNPVQKIGFQYNGW